MKKDVPIRSDQDVDKSFNIDSILVFNHTVVLSGGELALLSLLGNGMAKHAHVHVDRPGPLTDSLSNLPQVSWSSVYDGRHSSGQHPKRRIERVLSHVGAAFRMRRSYKSILQNSEGGLVYANTLRSALILCTLKHHDKTVVYHQRDRLTADYLGTLTSLMAKSLIGMRFRFVIANSASTASTTPRGAKHIYILPSSVGSEFYKLKLPPSDSVIEIVMVGRLAPWKGQAEFIKALVVLKDELRLTNWRVRIVGGALFGESEYEDQLKTLINDNNLSDYVQLTGHVDNVSSIVGASHILVHSSTVPEPFGQVVAQGMASGRAIVAANAGGPAEMLVHNESALLIDPENALTFANSLGQLIASSTLRARLGSSARLAAEGFRIAQVQNQLRVYLSDIVRKAGN